MKLILLALLFATSTSSLALVSKAEKIYKKSKSPYKNGKIAQEMYKSKYFFSAVIFAKEHLIAAPKISQSFEALLEDLILKTGTTSFIGLKKSILKKHPSTSLNFILGIKNFNEKRYKTARKYMRRIPKDHRFAPEAYFIRGSSLNLLDQFQKATTAYNKCIESASDFRTLAKNEKLKRYFSIIQESCVIHKARVLFKERKYPEALKAYDAIPKTSYRWPFILLEKAWSSYHLGDFNRSLGLLVTYKSPLLSSYFFPEAEVLNSLSYFKMCLWKDSLSVIDQYYKVYRPRSLALKKILLKHKSSHTYFLKLLSRPIHQTEKMNPFIRNLITQVRKKIKFNLDLANYKKVRNELKYLKKRKQTPFIGKLTTSVQGTVNWRTKHLNHYVKKQMFNFINEIHRYSYEMFNVKLEILALKRDLVYTNKKLISNRNRGSFDNIKRSSRQHLYHFKGAFWADELGEYSFGLKSNCKRVKKEKVLESK